MAGVKNGIVYSESVAGYGYYFTWEAYGQKPTGEKIVRWKLISDCYGSYSQFHLSTNLYDELGNLLEVEGISSWKMYPNFSDGEMIDNGEFVCPLNTNSISVEGYCAINGGYELGIAGAWEITDEYIPSPSLIACSAAAIGEAPTITITKQDVDTSVNISYNFGTLSGTIVEGYAGEVYNGWIIPESFYNEMTDSSSKKGTMSAVSYRNGVMTGTETCSFTVKVDSDECAPDITVEIADTNSATTAITKDYQAFIRGYSNASVTVTATGKNGASIASYIINNGGRTATTARATFNGVTSESFVVTVTDSRGVSATKSVLVNMIDYTKVTCVVAATPPNTDGETTITVSGKYFNRALGNTANTLVIEYRRWRHGDGSNDNWMTITPTTNQGSYWVDLPLDDLDYKSAYTFEARATDLLSTANSSVQLKTIPVFSWSNDDFEFNVDTNINGGLETNTLSVDTSTELKGSTSINGTVRLGGDVGISSGVTIEGDVTANKITADSNVDVGGSLTVDGNITTTSKITTGDLQVNGDVSFKSSMTFNGIEVNGNSYFNKPVQFDDDTTFSEPATFQDVTINGTLTYDYPFVDYVVTQQGKSLYPGTTDSPYVQWGWRYRIWKNGYAECWGQMNESWRHLSGEDEVVDVPFPITFADTNYILFVQPRIGAVAGSVTQGMMVAYECSTTAANPRRTSSTDVLVKHLDYSDEGDAYYNLNVYICGSVST